jgi:hypothetical protein
MDSQIFVRPEVILNACPADGESLFRVFGDDGVAVYECLTYGYRHEGDFQAFA